MPQASSLSAESVESQGRHAQHQLSGNMGVVQLSFSVLAYNAPLAVLATLVVLVVGTGIGAPLLFVSLGLLMGLFAVGYTAMSRHMPNPGAFYAYITAGLGRPLGLGSSFVAMLSYTLAMVGVLIFTSNAIEDLVHTTLHGPNISWWIWALAFIGAVGLLGYRRVDVSARVLGILLGLELLIVAAWEAVVLVKRGGAGELAFSSFNPHVAFSGSISVGLIFAVICFSGFEATAVFRDEVRDPQKTVSRATYLSIGLLTLFYTLGSWVVIQSLGEKNALGVIAANPMTAFFDSVNQYLGAVGYHLVNLLIISGGFAGMMAYHNVLGRYLYSLGVDGILPHAIGVPHPKLRSPYRASLLLSTVTVLGILAVMASGSSASDMYMQLSGIAGYSFIILFVLASIGIACYLVRSRTSGLSTWQRVIAPVSAAILMVLVGSLVTAKLDLLTNSAALSTIALGLTYGSLLAGVVLALVFRMFKPAIFSRIGRQ